MSYLIDTNICVHFLRGNFRIDEIFKKVGLKNCYISEITVFELRFGAENSSDKSKSHKAVDVFIKGLQILPIYNIVDKYAEEKVRLRKIGKSINDEFDLIIGVTAIANNMILITENSKDFMNLSEIKIENWVVRK